jgi:PIN domain nuclease of toxin-antitoxin system
VTLLDAYALIAFLAGGPAAPQVRSILRDGDAAVTSTNLAETLDVSQRVYGLVRRAMEFIELLLDGPLTPLPLTPDTAVRAAAIRAEHHHRTRRPVSLADAVLIGSATEQDRIATADLDVIAAARDERVATIELPQQG